MHGRYVLKDFRFMFSTTAANKCTDQQVTDGKRQMVYTCGKVYDTHSKQEIKKSCQDVNGKDPYFLVNQEAGTCPSGKALFPLPSPSRSAVTC